MAGLLLALSGNADARCGNGAVKLSDVQGSGASSPMVGQTVTVEGVITLDSRQPGGWRGFYLQQPDHETDENPRTSDALFIYTDLTGGSAGTRVRVTGRVKEFHGLTELTQVSELSVCGPGQLPEPTAVQLPWPGQKPPEHLENMRVTLTRPLTLIGHYSFARYGELILADRPQVIPTDILPPGPEAREMARQQALNRLYLDDGRSLRNPTSLPWPAELLARGQPVRAGDRLEGLTGILDYRFGQWRLQPADEPQISDPGPRPESPARPASATLRVVTLNLDNYFNGDGTGQDFAGSRGARSKEQLSAQTSRLVATLTAMDPDIIAAVEMENDDYGDTSAIASLTKALGTEWRFVATPGATGTDAIRTDLLYRADRVRTEGEPLRLTGARFSHRGRPPIAQNFRPLAGQNPASLRVVVPHLKSKACGGATGANRDQQDGQGCYARRRTESAEALAEWIDSLPEPDAEEGGFAGTLVTGDLNSYAREWPIRRLEEAGLINLVRTYNPCRPDSCPRTSFRYQGRQGTLDYSMASKTLTDRVIDAGIWPVNAEEFRATGYQGQINPTTPGPWRSSDHNPVYTDLAL